MIRRDAHLRLIDDDRVDIASRKGSSGGTPRILVHRRHPLGFALFFAGPHVMFAATIRHTRPGSRSKAP